MSDPCVAVFTARSPRRIIEEGGSAAWALDANRARKATYLICIQNQHNPDRDFSDASEAHGMAFLVGKISDVVPAPDRPDRWLIRISEFAFVQKKDAWKGWRNPVRYTTLTEFGIDPDGLTFKPLTETSDFAPSPETAPPAVHATGGRNHVAPISMAEAKPALAAFYGVTPEAIEIVIRG